jgi:hypothetical protein
MTASARLNAAIAREAEAWLSEGGKPSDFESIGDILRKLRLTQRGIEARMGGESGQRPSPQSDAEKRNE